MKKINKYLWAIAGIGVFVVCISLFVTGINENQKIDNANKPLIDNKTTGDGFSEPTSNNLNNNNEKTDNGYENMKPEGGEIEIKLGAKVDVNETHIPKEKLIEAIVSGDKKVTEEDIVVIAKELNISAIELKKEIKDSETQG